MILQLQRPKKYLQLKSQYLINLVLIAAMLDMQCVLNLQNTIVFYVDLHLVALKPWQFWFAIAQWIFMEQLVKNGIKFNATLVNILKIAEIMMKIITNRKWEELLHVIELTD